MSWYRWLFCGLCLVVADGAWLYPLLGFTGFVAGLGHAPVSFAALEAVLLVSAASTALAGILPAAWLASRALRPAAAALGLWLGVSVCAARVGVDAGPGWPLALLALEHSPGEAAALLIVAGVLGWCWWHAARRMDGGVGAPVLARGFRAGLVAMVTVLTFEAAGGLDLGVRAALLPFFVASLLGLAAARAPVHGSRARAWVVLTAGALAVVLIVGLALGVVLVVAVRGGLGALSGLWLRLATAAAESVGATLESLFGGGAGDGGVLYRPHAMAPPDWFVMAVLLAGAAVMAALTRRLLQASRNPLPRMSLDLGEEERESLGSPDSGFLRRWTETMAGSRPRRRAAAAARGPAAPGIREMHRLYGRLLDLARRRGIPINPAHTPFERAGGLARALPGIPVDAITRGFVDARYGVKAPAANVIDALARSLDET